MHNSLNEKYWSERYQNQATGWDIGYCSTPIQTYFKSEKDKDKKILIPGAGFGHEAIYLHQSGFRNITVVDLAKEPLEHLKANLPDFPTNSLVHQDFFDHEGQYDLIVEQTFFCALDPLLRESYAKKMKSLLVPGGKIIGVLFDRTFEGGPPFGGAADEYRALFKAHFKNVQIEPCHNSIPARQGSEVFLILQ